MKLNKYLSKYLVGIILSNIIVSCGEDDNDPKFPTTPEQIAEAVGNTSLISFEGGNIIEEAISSAYSSNDLINPNQIVEQIRTIEGVESAELTSTGTGIVIKQNDGTYTNLLVITPNDERLFILTTIESSSINTKSVAAENENYILPGGDGKALILAPFHKDFNEDLDQLSSLLSSADFEVSIFEDEEADLSKFSGNYLSNYDVVYISTHGGANLKTRGGETSTMLLTGEEYTTSKTESLSMEEQKAITTGGHNGSKSYFAISVPWLKMTAAKNFANSWIYADACESAMIDNGSSSLSETFLNLGAAGYNGFDATINSSLSNPIAEKMMARFTSGLSFSDASNEVLNDLGLKARAWLLRLSANSDEDKAIRVELFDYNEKSTDPFYLMDPDKIVGTAKVIPESGTVGTSVVYEVTIKEKYISKVASIKFDIDNTGEHLTMTKINTNTWQRDKLRAPIANSYPRIDTFTFSAFDSDSNSLGQGSATFSILGKSSTKSGANRNSNYSAK